jgi:hypothetical protein
MRKARDWYFRDLHPESLTDFNNAMFGEQSSYLRMVLSYWEMAAALVNNGAISMELFTQTNGEFLGAFCKVEPLLSEIRGAHGPQFAANLEKLADAMPNGRERAAATRERLKGYRAQAAVRAVQQR